MDKDDVGANDNDQYVKQACESVCLITLLMLLPKF